MTDKTDAVVLPDCKERNELAREVLDFLRPKGCPIKMIREVLNLAVEKLDYEPLREPRAVYTLKSEK